MGSLLPDAARQRGRRVAVRCVAALPLGIRRRARSDRRAARFLRAVWTWAGKAPVPIRGGGAKGLLVWPSFDLRHVQARSLLAGALEPEVQDVVRRWLEPGSVFYDIGANIGFFSLIGARAVGSGGRVYAFEPVAENAAAVRANAALNGFDNVCVLERAVSSEIDRARLLLVADRSWSMLDPGWLHPETIAVLEVETTTIDDLLARGGLPAPDVIKIDVEGAELDVIRGAGKTLSRHRPTIICEAHGTMPLLYELLRAEGYEIDVLDDGPPEPPAPVHILARPSPAPGR